MVQKVVNVKVKADLRSSIIVWDSDACYLRSHRPSYNTFLKVQTQYSKDSFRSKKPKSKDPKSALSYDNIAKLLKKSDKKDKKKRFRGQRRKNTEERKKQTLATSINTTNVSKKKKKKCDINEITYFNCNKKDYFVSNYTEPKN